MLREFIKRILNRKKYDDITRARINFIYRFVLNYYEYKHRNNIDFPAFVYADRCIKRVIRQNIIDEAYIETKNYLRKEFERERNAV